MRLTGIKRKRDGEIIGTVEPGVWFKLPAGETPDSVEYVSILIPEVQDGRLMKGADEIGNMARHFGMNIADFIELCAGVLGIPPCSSCKMSKMILYAIKSIGWLRGMKLIFKAKTGRPFTEKERQLLETLKEKFITV